MNDSLSSILTSDIKLKIIRLFASRGEGYQAAGREVARLVGTTAPTSHAALKELYAYHVLNYSISGRNHLYSLNRNTRLVKDIILPMLDKENDFKKDVFTFILTHLKENKLMKRIISIIFYGSQQKEKSTESSDIDIAVIVRDNNDIKIVEDLFIDNITSSFYDYFGVSLDAYIKTKKDFIDRLNKNLPPVSTLMKSYSLIYGEDPLNWK
ncbi:MAG: nucleotidyltransferase domain-containing protein [Candidatus Omnitrophica bacterium]|nr:nucleotidyltransferase domain-containing protein [Candidatus Omnitrophota bacterium]